MTRIAVFTAAALVLASLGAATAEAQVGYRLHPPVAPAWTPEPAPRSEPEPEPVRTRADSGLVTAGATMLIGGYAANLGGSLLWSLTHIWNGGVDTGAYLLSAALPVAGPFVQLNWSTADFERGLLVATGTLQVAGLALLIAGLVTRHPVEPRAELGGGTTLSVLPTAGAQGGGLTVTLAH